MHPNQAIDYITSLLTHVVTWPVGGHVVSVNVYRSFLKETSTSVPSCHYLPIASPCTSKNSMSSVHYHSLQAVLMLHKVIPYKNFMPKALQAAMNNS